MKELLIFLVGCICGVAGLIAYSLCVIGRIADEEMEDIEAARRSLKTDALDTEIERVNDG